MTPNIKNIRVTYFFCVVFSAAQLPNVLTETESDAAIAMATLSTLPDANAHALNTAGIAIEPDDTDSSHVLDSSAHVLDTGAHELTVSSAVLNAVNPVGTGAHVNTSLAGAPD